MDPRWKQVLNALRNHETQKWLDQFHHCVGLNFWLVDRNGHAYKSNSYSEYLSFLLDEEADEFTLHDKLDGVEVLTHFVGVDVLRDEHEEYPVDECVFQTYIFGGPMHGFRRSWPDWSRAKSGHERTLQALENAEKHAATIVDPRIVQVLCVTERCIDDNPEVLIVSEGNKLGLPKANCYSAVETLFHCGRRAMQAVGWPIELGVHLTFKDYVDTEEGFLGMAFKNHVLGCGPGLNVLRKGSAWHNHDTLKQIGFDLTPLAKSVLHRSGWHN